MIRNKIVDDFFTFDDVVLIPQYSTIDSRKEVDLSIDFGLESITRLEHPLLSSNMDSITELEMAKAMGKSGGMGILHRYKDKKTVINWIKELNKEKLPAVPSVGVKGEDLEKAIEYEDNGATIICVDVAHADQKQVFDFINKLSNQLVSCPVIAGNVVDGLAAYNLYNCGADAIKIGIGNGSMCTTRVMTGHGKPQLSALLEADYIRRRNKVDYLIICDGGIKTPGDCVKALAAGADLIMSGYIFAGCNETPSFNGSKRYRGMASRESQEAFRGSVNNGTPEGEAMEVKPNGSVQSVIDFFLGGIRSGLSYSGAKNIGELQTKAKFGIVTQQGHFEGLPNGLSIKR